MSEYKRWGQGQFCQVDFLLSCGENDHDRKQTNKQTTDWLTDSASTGSFYFCRFSLSFMPHCTGTQLYYCITTFTRLTIFTDSIMFTVFTSFMVSFLCFTFAWAICFLQQFLNIPGFIFAQGLCGFSLHRGQNFRLLFDSGKNLQTFNCFIEPPKLIPGLYTI